MQILETSAKPRMRSEVALLNSAASRSPRSSAGTISAPGSAFTAAPMPVKRSIEIPTVRHFLPLESSGLVVTKPDDFKGMQFRTVGISIDLFTGMGAAVNALPGAEIVPALDRGLIDAAEFNNASSDRALGFQDVSKICMLQSYHQNAEQFEIMFNKTKYDALPDKIKAIIAYSVEAASQDMSWKAIDRYSKDYIELQAKEKVRFYKTPDSVLQKQLEVFDQVEAKYSAQNPLFKEIVESQRKYAERAVKWDLDTNVNRRMAYNYYFAKKAAAKPAAPAAKPEEPPATKPATKAEKKS